jgi:hypothetical protein
MATSAIPAVVADGKLEALLEEQLRAQVRQEQSMKNTDSLNNRTGLNGLSTNGTRGLQSVRISSVPVLVLCMNTAIDRPSLHEFILVPCNIERAASSPPPPPLLPLHTAESRRCLSQAGVARVCQAFSGTIEIGTS